MIPSWIAKHTGFTPFFFAAFVFFAIHLGNSYYTRVTIPFADLPNAQGRLQLHEEILNRTAVAPYRYRVLYPYLTEGVARTVRALRGCSKLESLKIAWDVTDKTLLFLMFCCLYFYCRKFYPEIFSFFGVLVVFLTMEVTFMGHGYAPWYFIEPSLIALTLYFGLSRNVKMILILTILGRLNRDTGSLLPVYYLIVNGSYYWNHRTEWKKPVFLILSGIVMDFGVRSYQGWGAPYCHPTDWEFFWLRLQIPGLLRTAAENWRDFLSWFWICFIIGRYTTVGYVRRSLMLLLIHIPGHLRIGAWHEVQALGPMYAVFLTVGLDPLWRLHKYITKAPDLKAALWKEPLLRLNQIMQE